MWAEDLFTARQEHIDNTKRTSTSRDRFPTPLVEIRDDLPNGRGLALTQDVQPGKTILTLPSQFLIHVGTVSKYFHHDVAGIVLPSTRRQEQGPFPLSSMQVLSLVLVGCHTVNRAGLSTQQHERMRDLVTFHASLPKAFESHPLMWRINHRDGLLDALLPQVRKRLESVYTKFVSDWQVIQQLYTSYPHHLPWYTTPTLPRVQAYAHSWLSINSRSVYFNLLLPRHEDNFTLVPILDMANHTNDPNAICSIHPLNSMGNIIPEPSRSSTKSYGLAMKASNSAIQAGNEVLIQYGARDDSILLSEYGFLLGNENDPYNCIDIDPYLSPTSSIEAVLKENNLWKDWKITSQGQPDWRTLSTLRLMTCEEEEKRKWKFTLTGQLPRVSQQNDSRVKRVVQDVCERVVTECKERYDKFESGSQGYSEHLVKTLLKDQMQIAHRTIEQCNSEAAQWE
ncbi:unnamed protein product [Sympodiomycopsis kandeliae]